MKKKFCTLLTLSLIFCTVFHLPVRAAEGDDLIAPQANNRGFLSGVVEDRNGYWYLITCVTDFGGPWALVSTSFGLMDHRFPTKEDMEKYAQNVKAISAYADVVTWNSASDSFGTIGYVRGESYEHKHTKSTYLFSVLSVVGRHGLGSDDMDYREYNTNA